MRSFARGLAVIACFGAGEEGLALTEVADRVHIPRAAARRLLLTLQALGYCASDGRLFYLTPRVLELGHAYLHSIGLWRFVQPIIADLVGRLKESCSIAVLDSQDIVYVLRIPAPRILMLDLSVGSRLPAYATSMGRILLGGLARDEFERYLVTANLERITPFTVTDKRKLREIITRDRAQGWSFISEELEQGVCSVSVPLENVHGQTVAALSVSASSRRMTRRQVLSSLLPPLREAAQRINIHLHHSGRLISRSFF